MARHTELVHELLHELAERSAAISHLPGASRLPSVSRPFEDVVARYGAVVLRVCRATLAQHEAEDAWSETFLAALRAYPHLDPNANVEAWLVTIARRKVIDAVRAAARRPTPAAVADQPVDPGIAGRPELAGAVRALPPKQRQAVAYHYLAGLPHREVAELLGGTPEAARRAAADGIEKLRRTYHPEPEE